MHIRHSILFAGSMMLALQGGGLPTAAAALPSLAPMLETVTPAVVNIRTTRTAPTSSRFIFRGEELPGDWQRYLQRVPGFRNESPRSFASGAGSGVIVDARAGLVVTNHHVVDGATAISVQLNDGRALEAELAGSDARTDVALLRIPAEGLTALELADIDSVRVGDWVVAIGNPFGMGQTVTSGIVSALGRTGFNNGNYEDFIQTDAAINVGNSGGALVDLEGRLIGINTAILTGNGGSNGVGFAVPVDMVAAVMEHLERDGEVRRGLLGVNIVDLGPDVKEALDLDLESGAVVVNVLADSAAERAGIQVSDVITEIDGRAVAGSRELRNIVGLMRQDQQTELRLYRNGEAMDLTVTIGGEQGRASSGGRSATTSTWQGAQLRSVEPNTHAFAEQGVEALAVRPGTRAWTAGLRPGDVITELNGQTVTDLAAFNAIVEDEARFAALAVMREGRPMLLFMR